jgi:hypothetical protein
LHVADPVQVGEDAQDLLDGEHPGQVDVPGREVEPAQQRRPVGLEPPAEQPHLAGVGGDQPEDHVQGGGLAGAVGAEQADDLAGADREADAVHGGDRPEPLADVTDVEDRHAVDSRPRQGRTHPN